MRNRPTTPTTTCGQHRIQGYAFVAGLMVCRGCQLPASYHESIDQTLARKATAEYVAS
jgi:hypothetical protein